MQVCTHGDCTASSGLPKEIKYETRVLGSTGYTSDRLWLEKLGLYVCMYLLIGKEHALSDRHNYCS